MVGAAEAYGLRRRAAMLDRRVGPEPAASQTFSIYHDSIYGMAARVKNAIRRSRCDRRRAIEAVSAPDIAVQEVQCNKTAES
jgi:hypothetical protein